MTNHMMNDGVFPKRHRPPGWVHPFVQAADEADARLAAGESVASVFARLEQQEGRPFARIIRFALESRRAHGR